MDFIMENVESKPCHLSQEETREILTPLAFNIDQSLFGTPLALPWRRGVAIIIDLFLVTLLSGAPGELLALLVAVTLFSLGSQKRAKRLGKKKSFKRSLLRVFASVLIFLVLLDVLPALFSKLEHFNSQVQQTEQSQLTNQQRLLNNSQAKHDEKNIILSTVSIATNFAISQSECQQYACWLALSRELFSTFAEQKPTAQQLQVYLTKITDNITNKSALTEQELRQLSANLQQLSQAEQASVLVQQSAEKALDIYVDEGTLNAANDSALANNQQADNPPTSIYKGFAWLKGLVEDLGLGFGWAAFYFTMFTALWYGQTPGKRLVNIKVIQLDGTPLSIWDSFGRYGGYGAGIATGLLGFIQIYWDPNRQAIHDKISSTIVINTKATSVPVTAL